MSKHLLKIYFRTDASVDIGSGHVMRCLTLADTLRARGARCYFICRPHHGHLFELIKQRGYEVHALAAPKADVTIADADRHYALWLGADWQTDAEETRKILETGTADWLVVDHYALDKRWESIVRAGCKHIMVIDDLADRPHDCDLLLDQNLGRLEQDYVALLPPHAERLVGQQYALLRPEFGLLRAESLARRRARPQFNHLLITMGGIDKDNVTGEVLEALQSGSLPEDLSVSVLMGMHAPWLEQVRAQVDQMKQRVQVVVGVSNVARLMADSDLAIGAAGGTAWERCSLGLPSLILVIAENQKAGAEALQQTGGAIAMQSAAEIQNFLLGHLSSGDLPELLQEMSLAAAQITDGNGVNRAVQQMMGAHA